MRIVIHDYSGHPFQAQLSRELARRGHEVTHLYSSDFQTPKGRLQRQPDDPPSFDIRGISLGEPFQKDTFVKRRAQEERFGRIIGDELRRLRPDVVISSNAPLDTQKRILQASKEIGAGFVFWIQDIYSEGIARILTSRFGLFGQAVGVFYRRLEFQMLRQSDQVVAISEDFSPILVAGGLPRDRLTVIENWAPLAEIDYAPPASGPREKLVFVYSGTLGYKHNPELLVQLAQQLPIEVRIYSEGRVANKLAAQAKARHLDNLRVHPWVPFDQLSSVLGSADVLLAMIEPEAGIFSVPSKVLTYLSAGRPILAAIPAENLAARILKREGAGLVSRPGDVEAFVGRGRGLTTDFEARVAMGGAGRTYAERTFDIDRIGDRFETVISAAASARARSASHAA